MNRIGADSPIGQAPRRRAVQDEDLVALPGDFVHGERGRRTRDIEDRFNALIVEPLPGERSSNVWLVLMVGEDNLYRAPEHFAAEVVDRHARGRDASLAAEVGIRTRHVKQEAELQRRLR